MDDMDPLETENAAIKARLDAAQSPGERAMLLQQYGERLGHLSERIAAAAPPPEQ